MFPGSFFWKRISEDWLQSRTASVLFALSAGMIVGMTGVWFGYVHVSETAPIQNIFLGVAGALSALSIFFLWGGMWSFWLRCDTSRRTVRRLTFLLLAIGIWYGAILYYLLIYLPGIRKRIHSPTAKEIA
jgi:hypothetical protein